MELQPIFDIPEICHQLGITNAVISPGSRNGTLTVAFSKHPNINCYSVSDERSAAFIALGMSLQTRTATVLICTSGSAGLNYAPAIAEAFFNQVPLLILTADRPPEQIGIRDGQTIFQSNLFGLHVKKFFDFPSLSTDQNWIEKCQETITEAIHITTSNGMGPVHINIPFREPFYPTKHYQASALKNIIKPKQINSPPTDILEAIKPYQKVLIVAGQGSYDKSLIEKTTLFTNATNIPVVADVISNLHEANNVITNQDLFLKGVFDPKLAPDLLLTFGLSVISKNLKIFLRACPGLAHWHISENDDAVDTFGKLSKHVKIDPEEFFSLAEHNTSTPEKTQTIFQYHWAKKDDSVESTLLELDSKQLTDIYSYKKILDALTEDIDLHLANSMAVRYANFFGLKKKHKVHVFCNRGTSGIDGSNSTAVGSAIVSKKKTILLTGDMAFFYDRNAFWHNHIPDNLSIIVLNNSGGGIFRLINGPSGQDELEEFFETKQQLSANHLASEFSFDYHSCRNSKQLDRGLEKVYSNLNNRMILEIFTDKLLNKIAYQDLFKKINDLER